MKIKVLKKTPFRHGHEKEIKVGEIHEVVRSYYDDIFSKEKKYFIMIDGKQRMLLESDCEVVE